jgi:hypothetical protein
MTRRHLTGCVAGALLVGGPAGELLDQSDARVGHVPGTTTGRSGRGGSSLENDKTPRLRGFSLLRERRDSNPRPPA